MGLRRSSRLLTAALLARNFARECCSIRRGRPSLLLGLVLLLGQGHGKAIAAERREPTIVDVDMVTGHVAVTGPDRNTASAPGSTLKPIVLWTALRLGVSTPQTRVSCGGRLRVSGRNLACAHPASLGVLDAEEALAYSCNSYFARVAQQIPSTALRSGLEQFGIHTEAHTMEPATRVLLALGLQGVTVTPLQLAQAYVALARRLQREDTRSEAVRRGLRGSVTFGMAHAADTAGLALGGKTGTAHDATPGKQHGWFAGLVFGEGEAVTHVIAVYAPAGTGADAAVAAHRYLQGRAW